MLVPSTFDRDWAISRILETIRTKTNPKEKDSKVKLLMT